MSSISYSNSNGACGGPMVGVNFGATTIPVSPCAAEYEDFERSKVANFDALTELATRLYGVLRPEQDCKAECVSAAPSPVQSDVHGWLRDANNHTANATARIRDLIDRLTV